MQNFINKLQNKTAELAPNSPRLKEAFTRIGLYVSAAAKFNARRQRISDTGKLINSIRYELFTQKDNAGVRIAPFGTMYARYHEFGAVMSPVAVRGMFAAMRARGRYRPNVPGKGVFSGNAQTGGRLKARPFMRPALVKNQKFIIDTLRAAVGFAKY